MRKKYSWNTCKHFRMFDHSVLTVVVALCHVDPGDVMGPGDAIGLGDVTSPGDVTGPGDRSW